MRGLMIAERLTDSVQRWVRLLQSRWGPSLRSGGVPGLILGDTVEANRLSVDFEGDRAHGPGGRVKDEGAFGLIARNGLE